MKTFVRLIGAAVALLLIASAIVWFTPSLRTEAGVKIQIWGLNLGLIPLDRTDWGYLKLRSGRVGLAAVSDLEQHGRTDKIRQTSAAVQMQWFEAGHVISGGPFEADTVQEKETRFSDLRMPLDGMTLKQDLQSGQRIPESFWQTQRYRMNCQLPPKAYAIGECRLSMADVTGDGSPEVILDAHTVGTWNEYAKPVVGHHLTFYRNTNNGWMATRLHLCAADQSGASDSLVHLPSLQVDMLWLNGHAVNFFNTACFAQENTISDPSIGLAPFKAMAPQLADIQLLLSSKPLPHSLVTALYRRALVMP